ncbi:MAG TPA: cation transporter [Thermoanaerobaculia bacterium]|nr:cation transporter [Thermoanaerobaculia bacterium]
MEGVEEVLTDHEKKEAVVRYDDTKVGPERLIEVIEETGYPATVKGAPAASTAPAPPAKGVSSAASSDAGIPSERVSFFEVPLGCEAAEGLGCGSMAKPILRELEGKEEIAEARINHPGTVLAVVWKEPARSGPGHAMVEKAFKQRDLETALLRGSSREKALEDLVTDRWYRANEVDRLSEREGEVIAARLVGRVEGRLGLSKERAAALKKDLSAAVAKHLIGNSGKDCDPAKELMEVAGKHLNATETAELRRAAEQGIAALPGEVR